MAGATMITDRVGILQVNETRQLMNCSPIAYHASSL